MTAAQRLEWIRAGWWAGELPNAFVLDWNERPLGVIAIPALPPNWRSIGRPLMLPRRVDFCGLLAFDQTFPDELPGPSDDCVTLHPTRGGIFWRTLDPPGALEAVERFWPILEPLPDFRFLAGLAKAHARASAAALVHKFAAMRAKGR